MRWRDVRFEKPTEADGDKDGHVFMLLNDGGLCQAEWDALSYVVAWMPISELPAFTPIPDPPEGWRFVAEGDAFDPRAKWWNVDEWLQTNGTKYVGQFVYIVPIDPPAPSEPQYRAFASREEAFARFGEPVKKLRDGTISRQTELYPDGLRVGPMVYRYSDAFDVWVYMDGSPFGVKAD
jgi:hypothetical protein